MFSFLSRIAAFTVVAILLVSPALAGAGQHRFGPGSVPALTKRAKAGGLPQGAYGKPALAARRDGFLTPPSRARATSVALGFLQEHEAFFGLADAQARRLELVRRYRSGSGAVHLLWSHTYRGIPAFRSEVRASVDDAGRLINVGNSSRRDLSLPSVEPRLSALDALLAVAGDVGAAVVPGLPQKATGPERATRFTRGHEASLTLFDGHERTRLAWRVLIYVDEAHVFDAVVDAGTGETLFRRNLVLGATGLAFGNYPGAPVGGTQTARTFPTTGSDAWLTASNRLSGNNAHVYSDEDDRIFGQPGQPNPEPGDEIPPSAPGAWNYVQRREATAGQRCPPGGCSWRNNSSPPLFSWRENREQVGTQLFYFVNRFHDHLRDAQGIGFGETSGNFEAAHTTGAPGAGDAVRAQVNDGASTGVDDRPSCGYLNNAVTLVLPDGNPGLIEMFLFSGQAVPGCPATPTNDVNGADDALIVYHEYTHGMSSRLVTDTAGFSALGLPEPSQSGALGEGVSDWYALDFLNAQGLEPDTLVPGELTTGQYENLPLRTQPFDCPVGTGPPACPGTGSAGPGGYTYGDYGRVGPSSEIHDDGEIWAQTLWDLRARLIARYGVSTGITRARALVTDGLRLSPPFPTFLDLRNTILLADVNRGFGDRDRIWSVFAARGMGVGASTTGDGDITPIEDFTAPPPLPVPAPIPQEPAADTKPPVLSSLSMTRRRFAVGRRSTPRSARAPRGTVFRFRLSERADVRIAMKKARPGRRVGRKCRPLSRRLRGRRRCTRYVSAGALQRKGLRPGRKRVLFTGRIGRRALRLGKHRAFLTGTDEAGNRSRSRRLSFTVVPR